MISNKMENINLIRKIAWSFHKSTGVELDDLIQEGCLLYLKAIKDYNPANGKLSTFMWWVLSSGFKNYIKKYERPMWDCSSLEEIDIPIEPPSFLDHLTKNAQKLVDIIVDDIPKYSLLSPKEARDELRKEALKKENCSWKQIRNGLYELKLAFK